MTGYCEVWFQLIVFLENFSDFIGYALKAIVDYLIIFMNIICQRSFNGGMGNEITLQTTFHSECGSLDSIYSLKLNI